LRGSSDVICGIRATARGVRPQAKRAPSTTDRSEAQVAPLTIGTKQNHHGAFATMVNFRRNGGKASLAAWQKLLLQTPQGDNVENLCRAYIL